MSSVLAEFLQQLFTLLFTAFVVVLLGGKSGLGAAVVCALHYLFRGENRTTRAPHHPARPGQTGRHSEHSARDHHRQSHREGLQHGESGRAARFHEAAQRLFRANMRSVAAAALSSPLMDLFGAIAIALLLLLGRERINHHVFTPGTFLAFIVAVFKLYDPVRKFALFNNNFQQALGASSDIFSSWIRKTMCTRSPGAKPLPPFSQQRPLRARELLLRSQWDEAREVLRDINLEVKEGEVLAIVGSSGAGKSTLVHLIPRFFDVTGGRLLIDGHDVREVTLASLRSQIGIVTQDTVLFNDTVRNNIAYGQPHVSQKQWKPPPKPRWRTTSS